MASISYRAVLRDEYDNAVCIRVGSSSGDRRYVWFRQLGVENEEELGLEIDELQQAISTLLEMD